MSLVFLSLVSSFLLPLSLLGQVFSSPSHLSHSALCGSLPSSGPAPPRQPLEMSFSSPFPPGLLSACLPACLIHSFHCPQARALALVTRPPPPGLTSSAPAQDGGQACVCPTGLPGLSSGEQAGAWGVGRWCRRNEAERYGERGRPMGTEARTGRHACPLRFRTTQRGGLQVRDPGRQVRKDGGT